MKPTPVSQQRYDRYQMLLVYRSWDIRCASRGRKNEYKGEQDRLEKSDRSWRCSLNER
jgi:hypothetical protein